MTVHDAVQHYLDHLSAQAYSIQTVACRACFLHRFARVLPGGPETEMSSITSYDTSQALAKLRRHGKRVLKISSMNSYVTAVRSFFQWASEPERNLAQVNPARQLHIPNPGRTLPKALCERDIVRLLTAPMRRVERSNTVGMEQRDHLLVLLLATTGLRRAEAAALDWEDVGLEEGVLRVRSGKGNRDRSVPMLPPLRAALALHRGDNGKSGPLFVNCLGGRLHALGITSVFRNHVSKVLGRRVTPHQLRHSYAVLWLRGGGDIRTLQLALGHASLTNTSRYLLLESADVQAAAAKHPLARLTTGVE